MKVMIAYEVPTEEIHYIQGADLHGEEVLDAIQDRAEGTQRLKMVWIEDPHWEKFWNALTAIWDIFYRK